MTRLLKLCWPKGQPIFNNPMPRGTAVRWEWVILSVMREESLSTHEPKSHVCLKCQHPSSSEPFLCATEYYCFLECHRDLQQTEDKNVYYAIWSQECCGFFSIWLCGIPFWFLSVQAGDAFEIWPPSSVSLVSPELKNAWDFSSILWFSYLISSARDVFIPLHILLLHSFSSWVPVCISYLCLSL